MSDSQPESEGEAEPDRPDPTQQMPDERRPVDMAEDGRRLTAEAALYARFLQQNDDQLHRTREKHLGMLVHLIDEGHQQIANCEVQLEANE